MRAVFHAGEVYGNVLEQLADGQTVGFGGLNLEMEKSGEEEPAVVMTGDSGAFDFAGMLPGKYDVVLTLPQGYLSADAEDGEIRRTVELAQGDVVDFGTVTMCQSASISGAVRIDDDGDGVIAEGRAACFRSARRAAARQERPYRKHRGDPDGRKRPIPL